VPALNSEIGSTSLELWGLMRDVTDKKFELERTLKPWVHTMVTIIHQPHALDSSLEFVEQRKLGEEKWQTSHLPVHQADPVTGFVKGYEIDDVGYAYIIVGLKGEDRELRVRADKFHIMPVEDFDIAFPPAA